MPDTTPTAAASPDSASPDRSVSVSDGPVNGHEILAKVCSLPISTWRYHEEDSSIRHLGPMAQDFWATFGLGDDDKTIPVVDLAGVALVSIQALQRQVAELRAEVEALKSAG